MTGRGGAGPLLAALAMIVTACTGPPPPPPVASPTTSTPGSPTPRTAAPQDPAAPPTTPSAGDLALLTDVDAAATATVADLHVAAGDADALADLVTPEWAGRATEDRGGWPVYVGTATIGLDGTVDLDLVIGAPGDADGDLVLRWLPGAAALADAVSSLAVRVDGETVEPTVDQGGARLVVPVPPDTPVVVRVTAEYTIPARNLLVEDGSPASYGLLATTADAVMLGHWLPLVALASDDGPMQGRGDVGAFPPGIFSLVVTHDGDLRSGGREAACPRPTDGCSWLQGVGLRDLAAVLLADPDEVSTDGAGTGVRVSAPAGMVPDGSVEAVATEAAAGLEALTRALGPLPWDHVEVVAAPISPGAAGMEFPGIVWVDTGAWPEPGMVFGSYVLAHELGHQWFHALVGNGSLSHPVVDESLAQYLSVIVFDEVIGPGQGDALAARYLGGRHEQAVADGVPDDPPAQPLVDFSTDRSYGSAVYGRAGQAWVDADTAVGREVILAALRALVEQAGLREVTDRDVLAVVAAHSEQAASVLRDGWGIEPG